MLSRIARQTISPRGTTRTDRLLPLFRKLAPSTLSAMLDDAADNSELTPDGRRVSPVVPLESLRRLSI